MTSFEIDYIAFECNPQRLQLCIDFEITMEQFETLEIEDIDTITTSSPNMIKPIVNRNFRNTFRHQNGPYQIYHP